MSQKLINYTLALGLIAALLFGGVAAVKSQPEVAHFGVTLVNYFERGVRWTQEGLYVGSSAQFSVDSSGNIVTTGTITTAAGAQTSTAVTVNGVTDTYLRASSMTAASTTPCVLGPVTATSTLESLVANITSGTTTAATLTWATSTTPYATTSPIAQKTVAAGAQVTFDFHPTKDNSVLSPGNYLVLGEQGGVSGSFSNTGTCSAMIRSVN